MRRFRHSRLHSRGFGSLPLLIGLVGAATVLGLLYLGRHSLYDRYRLHGYTPPTAVSSLADQTTMTAYTRRVFYVNHPLVAQKSQFNSRCPNNGGEQTIVLGCYHSDQAGIYLLDISDSRLNGVVQVTAAHETLHAIYDRLSTSERDRVDAMLLDYYHNGLHDDRIKQTIEAYKKTEPTELVNEMHSIFGTEVADLPAPLETYYKQYFTNRHSITDFAARYQGEFTSRRTAITNDEQQLKTLKTQIDANDSRLDEQQKTITSQQAQLENLRASGNTSSFNSQVPAYNASVNSYNTLVQATRGLIAQYNILVADRNAVALEQNQLSQELAGSNVTQIQN